MPLHPKIAVGIERLAAFPPFHKLSPKAARDQFEIITAAVKITTPSVAAVTQQTISGPGGDLKLRIYAPAAPGPYPVTLFFHGGGFVIGSLDTHDRLCRFLCVGARSLVVSVGYRLAPESRFPAAVDDCFEALCWVADRACILNADPARIAVAGDSAGGNLATITAIRARDRGGPRLRGQLLAYPVTDHYSAETASYSEFAEGFGLTRQDMVSFWNHYLCDAEEASNPLASPLRAEDLGGLPSAYITTAEFDVLRDEGEDYGRKLASAGVRTETIRCAGMNHGFWVAAGLIDEATRSVEEACSWLATQLDAT